jgi:hypothetical protein
LKLAVFMLMFSSLLFGFFVLGLILRPVVDPNICAACRAQCAAAVTGWEGAIKLNRACLADLQDASDILRTASGRPPVANMSNDRMLARGR